MHSSIRPYIFHVFSDRAFAVFCVATVIGVGGVLALRGPASSLPSWVTDNAIPAKAVERSEQDEEVRLAHEQEQKKAASKAWNKQRAETFLQEKGRSVSNLYAAYCIANEDPEYLNALRAMCDDAKAASIVAVMTNNVSDAEHWRDIDSNNVCADLQCAWAKYQQGNASSEEPDYSEILEDIFSASTKPQYELPGASFDPALMEAFSYLGADTREQWTMLPQHCPCSFSLLAASLPSIISKQVPEDVDPARRAELADALWKIATTVETGEETRRVIEWEDAVARTLSEAELLSVTGMRHSEMEVRVREFEQTIPDNERFWAAMEIASEADLQTARDVFFQHGELVARRTLLERVDPAAVDQQIEHHRVSDPMLNGQ